VFDVNKHLTNFIVTLLTPNKVSSNFITGNSNKDYHNPQILTLKFAKNNRHFYDNVHIFLRLSQAQLAQTIIMYQPDIRF
jgi:hypothetical protein